MAFNHLRHWLSTVKGAISRAVLDSLDGSERKYSNKVNQCDTESGVHLLERKRCQAPTVGKAALTFCDDERAMWDSYFRG